MDGDRLRLLVRIPLDLLAGFGLPKRGAGFLDLANIDDKLKQVAGAAGRQIEFRADGVALAPAIRQSRISLLSDRSFASYASALAHLNGPRLPVDTELFWNQGFFDAELEYPLGSPRPDLSILVHVAPELGRRLKLELEYLPADGAPRSFSIFGGSGWIALDPRWHQAMWLFSKQGFIAAWGLERMAFLLCLIAPFRELRTALTLLASLAGLQAFTLTATALTDVGSVGVLKALFDAGLPAALLLVAIGNLAVPSVRVRWFLSALVGALGGFALALVFDDASQFAGTHGAASVLAFNLGAVAAELVQLILAFALMRWLFARLLGESLAVVVVSALLGHMAWHAMLERSHELGHQLEHAGASALSSALWLAPALVVGALGWRLPAKLDSAPVPSLLTRLLGKPSTRL